MTDRQISKDSLLKKKIQKALYVSSEQTLDDIGENSEAYPQECKLVLPGNKYHSNLHTASKQFHLKSYKFTAVQKLHETFCGKFLTSVLEMPI
jgi:hypothetical protein